jgi:hypothetical protein
MRITEMFDSAKDGYQDEQSDQTIVSLGDLRSTRLTLAQLNGLRAMNDVRSVEQEQKKDDVQMQYKSSSESPDGL